jgi:hypothetical protein
MLAGGRPSARSGSEFDAGGHDDKPERAPARLSSTASALLSWCTVWAGLHAGPPTSPHARPAMPLHQPIAAAVLILSSALALAGPTVAADVIHRPVRATAQAPTEAIGYSASHMDRSVDPREDFYAYANGNWLKRLAIPDAESDIGGFSMLGANLDAQLQRLAVQASQDQAPKGSPAQQVGDYYRAALDTPQRDAAGLQPLQADLAGTSQAWVLIGAISQVLHAFSGDVEVHERTGGNHRSSSKSLTALRCALESSGASITVGRRPMLPVAVRTSVALICASSSIMRRADNSLARASLARLTSISPRTVAKVCKRSEPSAHWCDGPQGTTPPFLARRNTSSTFHWPRNA